MKFNIPRLCLLSLAVFAAGCFSNTSSSKPDYTLLGGINSTSDGGVKAFSHPNSIIKGELEDSFILGRSFFTIPWVEAPAATTARDGLGPLFNSNTCISCHPNHGSGMAVDKNGKTNRSLLMRLALKDKGLNSKSGLAPDPHYGAQLNINGTMDVSYEGSINLVYSKTVFTYEDKEKVILHQPHYKLASLQYGTLNPDLVFSPRLAPALIGLGDLEAIKTQDILKYEDENDKNSDGISGKANWVYDPESKEKVLGRFTWKASAATVKYQAARAMINDMGLSNPYFTQENCTSFQIECLQAPKGKHNLDVPQLRLDAVSFYTSNLAVPKQRHGSKVQVGSELFTTIGCTACHVPTFKTRNENIIHPFTDLLLHDMGKDLGDELKEFLADGSEWRTTPLWGLGLRAKTSKNPSYLHDGRAQSVEEAILWHGGEAKNAKIAFTKLTKNKRKSLLDFLHSL